MGGTARITWLQPTEGPARIEIVDAQGRLRSEVSLDGSGVGPKVMRWRCEDRAGRRVACGVYYYRILVGGRVVHAGKITVAH